MNDADNPYASPEADLTFDESERLSREVVVKLGQNAYLWQNRKLTISAKAIPKFLLFGSTLVVNVDGRQGFTEVYSKPSAFVFYLRSEASDVSIQVDRCSYFAWRYLKYNLFINDEFIDQSVVQIENCWRIAATFVSSFAFIIGIAVLAARLMRDLH